MGKCIICGRDTDDFRCCVREDSEGKLYDDYQCEECTMAIVRKEREEYEKEFNIKVLPYLLENNFKVIVEYIDENNQEIIEEYPIKNSNVMYCVDIIRERMKSKGYYENWIDVHWEEFKNIDFEVVDYLCFALPNKDDKEWISYDLKLRGNGDLALKSRYY